MDQFYHVDCIFNLNSNDMPLDSLAFFLLFLLHFSIPPWLEENTFGQAEAQFLLTYMAQTQKLNLHCTLAKKT
jgi:hypothetical protein